MLLGRQVFVCMLYSLKQLVRVAGSNHLNELLETQFKLKVCLPELVNTDIIIIRQYAQTYVLLELFEIRSILGAPSQSQIDSLVNLQALLNPANGLKYFNVDEVCNAFLFSQLLGALKEALPQHVVHQQPVQPHAAPFLVLDIGETRDLVEVCEVGDAGLCLLMEALIRFIQRSQLFLKCVEVVESLVNMGDESGIRLSNLVITGLGVNLRSLSNDLINLLRSLVTVLLGNLEVVFQ